MPEKRSTAMAVVIGAVVLGVAIVFSHEHSHDDKTLAGVSVSPSDIVGSDGQTGGASMVTALNGEAVRSAIPANVGVHYKLFHGYYLSRPLKPAQRSFPTSSFAPASTSEQAAAGRAANNLALSDAGRGEYLQAISLWNQAVRLNGSDAAVYRFNRAHVFAQALTGPSNPLCIVPATVRPENNADEFLMLHLGGTPLYNVGSVVYTKIPAHAGASRGLEPPVMDHMDMFPPESYHVMHVFPSTAGKALGTGTVVLFVVTLSRIPTGLTDGSVSMRYTLVQGRDGALQWKTLPNAGTSEDHRSRTDEAGNPPLHAEIHPYERPDLHGPLGAADGRPTHP